MKMIKSIGNMEIPLFEDGDEVMLRKTKERYGLMFGSICEVVKQTSSNSSQGLHTYLVRSQCGHEFEEYGIHLRPHGNEENSNEDFHK